MAVGKIEYKKILKDENLTPTKLKDLYVSTLKENDTFGGYDKNFANDPAERYTIMTPEAAASLIASRQQKDTPAETSEIEVIEEPIVEVTPEHKKFEPIMGGTWMPIVLDEQPVSSKITFNDKGNFVQEMTDVYRKALIDKGYDPKFAEYIVAQDALESNWGKSQSGSNNFGGIKGNGTSKQTKEWDGSKMITITDSFRDFNDLKDYIDYKIDLVGNKRYNVFAYSPEEYFERMKIGGYATDPNYVSKLNNVLQTVKKYS